MLAKVRNLLHNLAERLFGPDRDEEFEPGEFGAIVDDDAAIEALRRGRAIPNEIVISRDELARRSDEEILRMLAAWRDEAGDGLPERDEDEGDEHRWYPEER